MEFSITKQIEVSPLLSYEFVVVVEEGSTKAADGVTTGVSYDANPSMTCEPNESTIRCTDMSFNAPKSTVDIQFWLENNSDGPILLRGAHFGPSQLSGVAALNLDNNIYFPKLDGAAKFNGFELLNGSIVAGADVIGRWSALELRSAASAVVRDVTLQVQSADAVAVSSVVHGGHTFTRCSFESLRGSLESVPPPLRTCVRIRTDSKADIGTTTTFKVRSCCEKKL